MVKKIFGGIGLYGANPLKGRVLLAWKSGQMRCFGFRFVLCFLPYDWSKMIDKGVKKTKSNLKKREKKLSRSWRKAEKN